MMRAGMQFELENYSEEPSLKENDIKTRLRKYDLLIWTECYVRYCRPIVAWAPCNILTSAVLCADIYSYMEKGSRNTKFI